MNHSTKIIGTLVATLSVGSMIAQKIQPMPERPNMEMSVVSKYSFEETIEHLQEKAVEEKFAVLAVHKMSETLESKGFPREPVTLIEICNAKAASTALKEDIRAGLMMPCPIMVYQMGEKVIVMTYDTRIMSKFYDGGAPMDEAGENVYKSLGKIIGSVSH